MLSSSQEWNDNPAIAKDANILRSSSQHLLVLSSSTISRSLRIQEHQVTGLGWPGQGCWEDDSEAGAGF